MSHPTPTTLSGFGLGLRIPHYDDFLETRQPVDFLEAISENFMVDGGKPLDVLTRIRERYPVVLHGVSMNIGSSDGVDPDYLRRLRRLADRIEPRWVSDHLCWTGVDGFNSHDLLPLPYSEEALALVVSNVHAVQDALGRPLVLENPSTYLDFPEAAMGEAAFLAELCARTGCYLLLDVNNVYVSAFNHGFDPQDYLAGIPFDRVVQLHVSGHTHCGTHIVDTHIGPVVEPVWRLLGQAYERCGASILLEWDAEIPDFEVTHAEALRAQAFIGAAAA